MTTKNPTPDTDDDESTDEWLLTHLDTPRDEWPEIYRRVVEFFEDAYSPSDIKRPRPRYPSEDEPYVMHAEARLPLREGGDSEYTWNILLNPYEGSERECWKIDGQPLKHEETAMGVEDRETDIVASGKDIIDVPSGRVYVCAALTEIWAGHSGHGAWIKSVDDDIRDQLDTVLDQLELSVVNQ